ncbi:MAG: SRPBCC family protein [Planctomycetota bacterium]
MRFHRLTSDIWVPRPIEAVFGFFADATNLEQLTPPWLRFRILTPMPVEMREGTLIDYRIRLHGVPLRWQTEISAWEPPFRFVDEQRRGPYRLWRHEHFFTAIDGGTAIRDEVRFVSPGGILEPLIHRCLVRGDVQRIFEYRQARLGVCFGQPSSPTRDGGSQVVVV